MLSLCILARRARARGRPRRILLSDSEAAPQSRKCRVADKKQTNQQTNIQSKWRDPNPRGIQIRAKGHPNPLAFLDEGSKSPGIQIRAYTCASPRGARGRPRRLLLSCSRGQRRKVDKCRVADKKQTDRQTNTHYSVIGIDELTKVGSDQRSRTIQYDSKSKHSKRRRTVN